MDYTELFDRYIDGLLKGKEAEEFERALEKDPKLQNDLERYRELHYTAEKSIGRDNLQEEESGIDKETDELSRNDIIKYGKGRRHPSDADMADFKQTLRDAEKDYLKESSGKFVKARLIRYAVAAIVLIALSFSVFIMVRINQQKKLDLYAAFFKPYIKSEKIFELTRSSDDFYYAIKVFEAGDYQRAVLLFSNLADSSELEAYALFYTGLASMDLGRWEEAISSFKSAIGCGENQITCSSRWYLGLCYLRIDDTESAKTQFKILASEKNIYSRKSRQILRILDRRR